MMKNRAFTIAEVLITLTILGVVAAITIPTVRTKFEQTLTIAQLKYAYSTLSNAIDMSIAENRQIESWNYSLNASDFFDNYLAKYLNITKKCNNLECEKTKDFYGFYDIKQEKVLAEDYPDQMVSYKLKNGMVLMCFKSATSGLTSCNIDVNGSSKGKNRVARDIFSFYLVQRTGIKTDTIGYDGKPYDYLRYVNQGNLNDGFYPGNYGKGGTPHWILSRNDLLNSSTHRACNKNASTNGFGSAGACTVLLIKYDNWKFTKDYPW